MSKTQVVKQLLHDYGIASGKCVNFNKSSISFSRNVSSSQQSQICSMLFVPKTADHRFYLGILLSIGRNKRLIFDYLKDRVWKKLNNWKTKKLSRVGKEVLLKTVAQAIPIYVMFVLLLPLSVCHDIENILNSYWWGAKKMGKGISLLRWENLCKPKVLLGGIGFKKLHDFNLALLGKQGWKLLTNPSSLVTQVYKARYFPHGSLLESKLGSYPSYAWGIIWAAIPLIRQYSRIQGGNGLNTNITKDPSLLGEGNGKISSQLDEAYDNAKVASLMIPGALQWDTDILWYLFNSSDREIIMNIPLSYRRLIDQWYWIKDGSGLYTVKSCYRIHQQQAAGNESQFWSNMWKLGIPSKVKNFMWRVLRGVLPTADNLRQRRVPIDSLCLVCVQEQETTLYA